MNFIQYLRSERRAIVSFLFFAACFTAVATLLSGCNTAPRHQRGGITSQTLGSPAPVIAPAQTLQQPENPEGESRQVIVRTVTTTTPTGDTVTTTEKAETVIGGSQDLADMLKAYAATEYTKRIALALILGIIAFRVRNEWPLASWGLGIGAVAVAFFGLPAVIATATFAVTVYVVYHVVRSQIPFQIK